MKSKINTKRFLALIFVLTMIVSMMGCSNSSTDSADTAPSPTSENETETKDIAWPEHSIEMVVPYSPGGDTDIWGRTFAKALSEDLGVQVVVTNMTGSSGSIGADYVKNADPDGYTVLFHHNALLVSKIFKQVDFTYTEFEDANILVDDKNSYWVVSPEKWPGGWDQMYAWAKEHPGELKVGCSPGSYQHLLKVIVLAKTGLDVSLVDAGDAASTSIETIAGRLDTSSTSLAPIKGYIDSGQLVPIASYRTERDMELAPDCPTWSELGYDVYGGYLYGTFFPKGTDEAIIDKWNAACKRAQSQADVAAAYETYNADKVFIEKQDAVDRWKEMWDDFMSYEEYFTW